MNYEVTHFLSYLERSITSNWNAPALSDFYGGNTLTYGKMAEQVARLHIIFEHSDIKKGDKIAVCGHNSVHWAVSFLAITTYEAVAVSILADFPTESIHALINHSDAKFLMVENSILNTLDIDKMPNLKGVVSMNKFEVSVSRTESLISAYKKWDTLFDEKYPQKFQPQHVKYPQNNFKYPAVINYTSGTTSDPKGVVISYLSLSSNIQFGQERIPNQVGWSMVSMLPLAHMFGLTFEFLYQLAGGCHVYFLNKTPSPQVLIKAFSEIHPYMILAVPLVIEKIFKSKVFPVIHKPLMRILWYVPGISSLVKKKITEKLLSVFGGQLRYLIIGGAALNHEVEDCLKSIKFPYTVGYGMTECGPILGYEDWFCFEKRSCGKPVHRVEVRIDSNDQQHEVGEIMVRGANIMDGYYKNEEATTAIFSDDGWMHTGDLGVMDKAGNIFIRGRIKNMILGSSGQNIYPEEIEDKLNNMPHVVESIVVERNRKLLALVYTDFEATALDKRHVNEIMELNRQRVNRLLPPFCRIARIEIVKHEFEKTPKRSIKRFLYQ